MQLTHMKLSDVGNNKEYNKVKSSIKEIFNSDNYCLIRAIVIAIAFIENDSSKHDMVKRPTNKKLMAEVHKAAEFCKIEKRAWTINDLI